MGCHRIVAADKPEIKKLAEYAGKQQPIRGRACSRCPSHLLPTRARGAKVACQTCHGEVEKMTTVAASTGRT